MLSTQKSSIVWPPDVNDCPDYWEKKQKGDDSGTICTNTRGLGKQDCATEVDFESMCVYW